MDNKMSEPADRKFAAEVIRLAGGRDNIERVFHCAVRLRLVLKEPELAQRRRLEKVKPVKGVFLLDGQLQLVIAYIFRQRLAGQRSCPFPIILPAFHIQIYQGVYRYHKLSCHCTSLPFHICNYIDYSYFCQLFSNRRNKPLKAVYNLYNNYRRNTYHIKWKQKWRYKLCMKLRFR